MYRKYKLIFKVNCVIIHRNFAVSDEVITELVKHLLLEEEKKCLTCPDPREIQPDSKI